MRAEIDVIFNLQREECVDVLGEEAESVIGPHLFDAFKLIDCSSGMETETLEDRERGIRGKAVNVHDTCLLDDVMRIVLLIDRYGDPVRCVCDLRYRIDDETIVLFAVV